MPAVSRRPPRRRADPARAPTIFDVAALAGVSKSTVSNVIRGVDGVSAETRARVAGAIERLGYRPNAIARQFVHQRTNIIGVLAGNLDNPFHGEMATRVVRAASRHGYTAMFCDIERDEARTLAGVELLLEQRVAGIVFLAIFGSSANVARAVGDRVPVVFIGLREEWADSAAVDDRRGTRAATRHLIELGHRRIGYLTSAGVEQRTARARREGYRSAMAGAGLPPMEALRWDPEQEFVAVRGRRVPLEQELARAAGPTAVVCSNDLGAMALLEVADRLGVQVPEQLSVVGFDNVHFAGLARIALTTVAQPLDDLARTGVEMLVERIRGGDGGPPRHLSLPTDLVVRGSTSPPAGGGRGRRAPRAAPSAVQ
jgi:LacI family transcriptional regulator